VLDDEESSIARGLERMQSHHIVDMDTDAFISHEKRAAQRG